MPVAQSETHVHFVHSTLKVRVCSAYVCRCPGKTHDYGTSFHGFLYPRYCPLALQLSPSLCPHFLTPADHPNLIGHRVKLLILAKSLEVRLSQVPWIESLNICTLVLSDMPHRRSAVTLMTTGECLDRLSGLPNRRASTPLRDPTGDRQR